VPNIRQKVYIKVKEEHVIEQDISPFKALDFIRDNSKKLGQLKGSVYAHTELRKVKKARLMLLANDCKTQSEKEAYAYANQEYEEHIRDTEELISEYETLRVLYVAAEAKIEVWRSLESSARMEGKSTL
jgi:hypothetical protein